MKTFGLMMIIMGVLFFLGEGLPIIGKLPGDILIRTRAGHTVFFPITSCILLSLLISLIFRRG